MHCGRRGYREQDAAVTNKGPEPPGRDCTAWTVAAVGAGGELALAMRNPKEDSEMPKLYCADCLREVVHDDSVHSATKEERACMLVLVDTPPENARIPCGARSAHIDQCVAICCNSYI